MIQEKFLMNNFLLGLPVFLGNKKVCKSLYFGGFRNYVHRLPRKLHSLHTVSIEIKIKVCKTRSSSHGDTRPNKKSISLVWNTFCVSMKGTGDEFTDQRLEVYTAACAWQKHFLRSILANRTKTNFSWAKLKLYSNTVLLPVLYHKDIFVCNK